MRAVDGGVRPVDVIGEQAIADVHGPTRWRDPPHRRRKQFGGEHHVAVTARLEQVDVLAELVRRIASRRGSRHAHFEGRPRLGRERHVHLQPTLFGRGDRDGVLDGLGVRPGGGSEQEDEDEAARTPKRHTDMPPRVTARERCSCRTATKADGPMPKAEKAYFAMIHRAISR